jgi:hypothetical protein
MCLRALISVFMKCSLLAIDVKISMLAKLVLASATQFCFDIETKY